MKTAEDEAREAIRPIRGCATDEQYVDVLERVTKLLKLRDANIARLKHERSDLQDELDWKQSR